MAHTVCCRILCVTAIVSTCSSLVPNSRQGLTTTHGRDFLLARFAKRKGFYSIYDVINTKIRLFIIAPYSITCTINYRGHGERNRTENRFIAHVDTKKILDFPYMPTEHLDISNSGIHVSCDHDVTLHVMSEYYTVGNHTETYALTALPAASLSTDYLIPGIRSQYPLLGIVAGQNNTHVEIRLKSECKYKYNGQLYDSGHSLSVVLHELDVLQLGGNTTCEFGGTKVVSDKPVAVFSGSTNVVPYIGAAYYDDILFPACLQVPPVTAFGTRIVIPALYELPKQAIVRILASQDQTSVMIHRFVDNGYTYKKNLKLQQGEIETLYFENGENVLVKSNKPIMAVQLADYDKLDEAVTSFIFYPDVSTYEGMYWLPEVDSRVYDPRYNRLTIVSATSTKDTVRISQYGRLRRWYDMTGTGYSVGSVTVDPSSNYISSDGPIFVRLNGYGYGYGRVGESYNYNYNAFAFGGGFSQKSISSLTGKAASIFDTQCTGHGWLVTVDLSKLPNRPSDTSVIYLGVKNCTGVVQGDRLIFSFSFDHCGTQFQIKDNQPTFVNKILYHPRDTDHNPEWEQAIQCMGSMDTVVTAHFDNNDIGNDLVDISLYTDPDFRTPTVSTSRVEAGTDIYVKVTTPPRARMVLTTCQFIAENTNKAVPLIRNRCPAPNGAKLLTMQIGIAMFHFKIPDRTYWPINSYVTCDFQSCLKRWSTVSCDQQCHNNSTVPVIIG